MDVERKTITLKLLNKQIDQALKAISKPYGYKYNVSGGSIYKKSGVYFITAFPFTVRNNGYKINVRASIKLYEYDNLFWNIFDMSDNANQPESLRAIGAFVAPSVEIYRNDYSINDGSEAEQLCERIMLELDAKSLEFIDMIERNHGGLDKYILTEIEDNALLKMLAYSQLGEYQNAKRLAERELSQGRGGRFRNKDLDFNEYILKYIQ